jgi:hypothetical protein
VTLGPGSPPRQGRDRRGDGDPTRRRRRVISFACTPYAYGRRWARTAVDVSIAAGSLQLSKDGKVIRVHPIRHDPARELGAFANPRGVPGARTPPLATPPDPQVGLRCRWRGRRRPASGATPASSRACGPCATACGRALDERASAAPSGQQPGRAAARPELPLADHVPARRATAACAASNEPRAASSAASFARECECRPARDGAASAGR